MTKYNYVAFFKHDPLELPLSLETRKTIAAHFGLTEKRIDQKFRESSVICRGGLCFERFPAERKGDEYDISTTTA